MMHLNFYLWLVRCALWFAFYAVLFVGAWLGILACTLVRPSNVYNTHPDWLALLRMVDLSRHWPKPPDPTPASDADWWRKA